MRAFFLWLLASLLCGSGVAHAWSRGYSPMSEYVRSASLIALVDAAPNKDWRETTLLVRETLKGGAKESVTLRHMGRMGPSVAPDARGHAALFVSGENGELELLETYGKPAEIEALRQVLAVAALPGERERLEFWRALLPNPNPLFGENFGWELRQMRDPNNFALLLDSLEEFDEAGKRKLVELVGTIGDARGVPWLLKIMNAPSPTPAEQTLARVAADQLAHRFSRAPGVVEAFKAALETPHLKEFAVWFNRERDPKLRAAFEDTIPTLRAEKMFRQGKFAQARRLWLEILGDPKTSDWTRLDIANRLAKTRAGIGETEFAREREVVLPILISLAREGDYSQLQSVAQIARFWKHRDAIEVFAAILSRKTEWIIEDAQRSAFAGLWEMGAHARGRAFAVLMARLKSEKPKHNDSLDAVLLPLCFLSDEQNDAQVVALLDPMLISQWKEFAPLREAARSRDETAGLIAVLQNPKLNRSSTVKWTISRLGENRDPRALKVLASFLDRLEREASDAIFTIGGAPAERETEALLRHPNADMRGVAVNLLVRLQGARALPALRGMIETPDYGSRSAAISQLGFLGTPEDLSVLIPLGDYWTGDRANNYWITNAIQRIRSRHDLS